MAQSSNSSYKTQKLNIFKRSPSVQQLREEVRKQFHEKLKLRRSSDVYKRRDIFKSVISGVQKHFSEIQESLLQGNEDELTDTEGMLRMLLEVEEEVRRNESEKQAEEYALYLQQETDAALENFCVCSICNKFIDFEVRAISIICDQCVQLHFNSEVL